MDSQLNEYIACLLKVAYPDERPSVLDDLPVEVEAFFHRLSDATEADRRAHALHLIDPSLRDRALAVLVREDGDWQDTGLWFSSEEEAQAVAEQVNKLIGHVAVRAEARYLWLFTHRDGRRNPWAVVARYWGGDVDGDYAAHIARLYAELA